MWRSCFISYRQEDTGWAALWLFDRLNHAFGAGSTFLDAGRLGVGQEWKAELVTQLRQTDVMIAMIGKAWLTVTKPDGRRRLDSLKDVVRFEIETALDRGILMVPLLVDGATCPTREDDVPAELKRLFDWQAMSLRRNRAYHDVKELLDFLRGDLVRTHTSERKGTEDLASGLMLPAPLTLESLACAVEPSLAAVAWSRLRAGEKGFLKPNTFGQRGSVLVGEVARRVASDEGLRKSIESFAERLEAIDTAHRHGNGAPSSIHETAAGRAYVLLGLAIGRI